MEISGIITHVVLTRYQQLLIYSAQSADPSANTVPRDNKDNNNDAKTTLSALDVFALRRSALRTAQSNKHTHKKQSSIKQGNMKCLVVPLQVQVRATVTMRQSVIIVHARYAKGRCYRSE